MTLLAAALLARQAPAAATPAVVSIAAEYFPLVPGTRRTYEERSDEGTVTLVDEIGGKTALFEDLPAVPVVQKSQFNQVLGTDYYRVVGATVYLVGRAEERSEAPTMVDGAVDLSKPRRKRTVLLALLPKMPVFRYDGKETAWSFGDIPYLKAEGEDPVKTDETAIHGTAKPGPIRTVLGRRVETIEVRAEVQLGSGKIGQRILETSVYGRGIGLIEATRRIGGEGQKTKETRTRLVAVEEKDGG